MLAVILAVVILLVAATPNVGRGQRNGARGCGSHGTVPAASIYEDRHRGVANLDPGEQKVSIGNIRLGPEIEDVSGLGLLCAVHR